MQQPDVRFWLGDLISAGEWIITWTEAITVAEYSANEQLKCAVERKFEVIAESLKRVLKAEPGLSLRFHESREIMQFRNILTHGYHLIDDTIVLKTARADVPRLVRVAKEILSERPPM
jgi:uncharacterized protein with HEPN domain